MDLRSFEDRLAEELEAASIKDNFFNFVIADGMTHSLFELCEIVFNGEPFEIFATHLDMFDVLISTGCFKSKSQAKQNWTKTTRDIDFGIFSFVVGKKKMSITVFKPICL